MSDTTIYRPRPIEPSWALPLQVANSAALGRAAKAAGVVTARRYRRAPGLTGKLVAFFLVLGLLGAYLASPLAGAYAIREAVAAGDSEYLRHRVDWPSIKATLKSSMTTYALGTPAAGATAAAPATEAETETEAEPPVKPGFWQRLKQAYGRRVVDGMVDSYVTPESLPKLFAYRESYHETVGTELVEPLATTWAGKIAREWRRLRRAEFLSPTRFAIEVQDRYTAGKSIAGVLELRASAAGIGWHLVSLEVKGRRQASSAAKAVTRAWSAMKQAALPVAAR